jgi:mono/diheme cytochrome c family protein
MAIKRTGKIIGAVVVVAIAVTAWVVIKPGPMAFADGKKVSLSEYTAGKPTGVPHDFTESDPLARGKYLAEAADCEACHTAEHGERFAGGRPFDTEFGTIFAPNITPDPETGIGSWSDADFLKAVHEGVSKDGENLYPAFPYASYTYLMKIWSALYNPKERFEPVADRSPSWNRGAYLTEALGHCGDCHTPRSALQALNNRKKFAGGMAEGWRAYNLSSDKESGIGTWTAEEMTQYLTTGHSQNKGSAFGPMAQAVHLSFQKLTPSDIGAIVEYVRSVPPVSTPDLPAPKMQLASVHPAEGGADEAHPRGHAIYSSMCAGCHSWTGVNDYVPHSTLTGTRAVNDPSATNVALAVLRGASTLPENGDIAVMPAFGPAWSDEDIAAVSNYVTARFGAEPSSLTAADVAKLRAMR